MEQAYQKPQNRRTPSFSALVTERFSDTLLKNLLLYAESHGIRITDPVPERVAATHFTLEKLFFHVIFRAVRRENDRALPERVILSCACPLADAFASVEILDIDPLSEDTEPRSCLPDDLVPVLYKAELDLVAQRILKRIYPRAGHHAEAISPDAFAHRLGLEVITCGPDPDPDLLGRIFFEDTSVRIRSLADGEPQILPVKRGTILVNTLHNGFIDRHLKNSTVLHECVHWILHRPAFLLAKAQNQHISAACRKRAGSACLRAWSAADRMEWQAAALSSRLLMPAWSARFVAESWLHRFSRLPPVLRMERVIDKLSQRFEVSRQLAKIRMTELGYEDAKSAFSYYERKRHQIPFSDAFRAFSNSPELKETLSSGAYAYIDGFFVLLDGRNVYRDEQGTLHLTPYAKANTDAVCLSFAARKVRADSLTHLFRYSAEDETFLAGSAVPAETYAKRTKAVMDILQKLPSGFSETLAAHMKRKCITNEQLAERCLMSDRQIYRFKSTLYPSISLRSAVGLCIGLRLHPLLSMDLIRKAGYSFNLSLEHMAYQFLLLSMSERSVYDCNAYLRSLGLKPIGKEE